MAYEDSGDRLSELGGVASGVLRSILAIGLASLAFASTAWFASEWAPLPLLFALSVLIYRYVRMVSALPDGERLVRGILYLVTWFAVAVPGTVVLGFVLMAVLFHVWI